MKFALVNNIRTEATKGAKGICPGCGSELIARCGEHKINHWAHKGHRTCDPWWEPETEWHRSWKNNYPDDWQEIPLPDEKTGEKHISDVCTSHNLVIEFQHSHIDPHERTAREKFYKNMVWVVDGTRLKRDYPRFLKGRKDLHKSDKQGIYLVDYLDELFPANWLQSSVPVIFDFRGLETINDINDNRHYLYCLFHERVGRYSILAEISRKAFLKTTIDGNWSLRVQKFIDDVIRPQQEYKLLLQQLQKKLSTVRYGQRRGPLIEYIEKKQFSNQYKPKRHGKR
jgi:hypothetical protein